MNDARVMQMGSTVADSNPSIGKAATSPPQAAADDALQVLRRDFKLESFHPGQQDVISRLLAGKSAAAVFPTGGGKSLCYQLPSQLFPGTTVVISPLIALMKDQCDALAARGIAAARIDSSLSTEQFTAAMQGVRSGATKLLYVAPERFFNERFRASIGNLRISLFAVDEAHCISRWGHNFRPDYLKLGELAKQLNVERVLALTATATPAVLDDIRAAFDIDACDSIRTRFFRPNLQLQSRVVSESERDKALVASIKSRPSGPSIVYVSLQKTAESVAELLAASGLPARHYHAGMADEARTETQQWFLDSANGIVVATIAFGMGIDKPDIRYVYHYNPPSSLEAYAQEVGRAGRDGNDSICELMLVPEDRVVLENFTYGDTPTRQAVGRLLDLVSGQPDTFYISHYQLSAETDIRILVARTLLTYLELDGYLIGTSPRYETYKVKPLVTSKHILSHFSGEPREFLAGMLSCLTKGRTWFLLNMAVAAKRLSCQRERLVKAVEHLVEKGWIEVEVSDLVHGYKKLKPLGNNKVLADAMFQRLVDREAAEIARLDDVFDLAKAGGCLAARLSNHFGEAMQQACGRCTSCRGDGPWQIPAPKVRGVGTAAKAAIEQLRRRFPDHLSDPRNRARFLCGLTSPAFTRAKLSRDSNFGICERVPFRLVFEEMGGVER
jgi:ATP-dependent DNA helicase RecQ